MKVIGVGEKNKDKFIKWKIKKITNEQKYEDKYRLNRIEGEKEKKKKKENRKNKKRKCDLKIVREP